MKATPLPPVDIVAHFPWLGEFAAPAVRLHPRRRPNLPVHISKMGGLFFWPRTVPWPVCRARDTRALFDFSRPDRVAEFNEFLEQAQELEELSGFRIKQASQWTGRHVEEIQELDRRSRLVHNEAYMPLLQLRREDFPAVPFPADTDLFQLLWCPHLHFAGPPEEQPGFLVFWRRQADLSDPLLQEPALPEGVDLFECSLEPEELVEFPVSGAFEGHFRSDLNFLLTTLLECEDGASLYDAALSAAPGVKLFGYPRWIGAASTPSCACGRRMRLLVTIDTSEAGAGPAAAERWTRDGEERILSHGFAFAEQGAIYLFYCETCRGPRLRAVIQTD